MTITQNSMIADWPEEDYPLLTGLPILIDVLRGISLSALAANNSDGR